MEIVDPFVDKHKIASWDITYVPLLQEVAKTRKPVILSTGASTYHEIETALRHLDGCLITLLHCTGGYPTPDNEVELSRMLKMSRGLVDYGFSCHNKNPISWACAAAMGASTLEFHFDYDGKGAESVIVTGKHLKHS